MPICGCPTLRCLLPVPCRCVGVQLFVCRCVGVQLFAASTMPICGCPTLATPWICGCPTLELFELFVCRCVGVQLFELFVPTPCRSVGVQLFVSNSCFHADVWVSNSSCADVWVSNSSNSSMSPTLRCHADLWVSNSSMPICGCPTLAPCRSVGVQLFDACSQYHADVWVSNSSSTSNSSYQHHADLWVSNSSCPTLASMPMCGCPTLRVPMCGCPTLRTLRCLQLFDAMPICGCPTLRCRSVGVQLLLLSSCADVWVSNSCYSSPTLRDNVMGLDSDPTCCVAVSYTKAGNGRFLDSKALKSAFEKTIPRSMVGRTRVRCSRIHAGPGRPPPQAERSQSKQETIPVLEIDHGSAPFGNFVFGRMHFSPRETSALRDTRKSRGKSGSLNAQFRICNGSVKDCSGLVRQFECAIGRLQRSKRQLQRERQAV